MLLAILKCCNFSEHTIFITAADPVCGGVLAVVLLEPTDKANVDNMLSDDGSNDLVKQMFSNARYRSHAEVILPWLNRRGLLDFL